MSLPAVQSRVNHRNMMPEGLALRSLLLEAAQQAIRHMNEVPSLSQARVFLESHLQGKKVDEIAQELGVSREWCSRAYRGEALTWQRSSF